MHTINNLLNGLWSGGSDSIRLVRNYSRGTFHSSLWFVFFDFIAECLSVDSQTNCWIHSLMGWWRKKLETFFFIAAHIPVPVSLTVKLIFFLFAWWWSLLLPEGSVGKTELRYSFSGNVRSEFVGEVIRYAWVELARPTTKYFCFWVSELCLFWEDSTHRVESNRNILVYTHITPF